MSLIEFLLLLVISATVGSIGQSLVGYYLGGCLVSAFVGFLGAFLGVWIAREFSFPLFLVVDVGGRSFPLIWSIIGASVLSFGLGLITRANRRSRPPRD